MGCNCETESCICCNVKNCRYHTENDSCCAGKINVGNSTAGSSGETRCDTFKTR